VSSVADFQTERPDEDDMEQSQTDDAEFCNLQADSGNKNLISDIFLLTFG